MEINVYQRHVLNTYQAGEFSHIQSRKELSECGDSLLRFLMIELSTSEDCYSKAVACQRVRTAAVDLNNVLQSLQDL